jgi:hypothetical protein
MHRSGTSALTGALGHLGLGLPAAEDLVAGRYDNPVHYESQALTDFDDALLAALGGSWSAPPTLDPGWQNTPAVLAVTRGATAAARRAFPHDGPVVWKDPRLCLVLPVWRTLLQAPVVPVFVWRAPLAVARSLRSRQGFALSLGLALWERYTRDALAGLAGHPGYILSYENLLADPRAALGDLAHWLVDARGVAISFDDDAIAGAAASVSGPLARHDGEGELPEVLHAATETLRGLAGPHESVPAVVLPDPPAWMADVVAQRRDYEELYARYMRYVRWRRRIPFVGWPARRPRRARPES